MAVAEVGVEQPAAQDLQRVANKYFSPENRTVALYYRKSQAGGSTP
jgi:predicted Zn-dependent peptidase